MKILFIGGTGTISMAITKQILKENKHELYLLNRGNRNTNLNGIKEINVDINGDINKVKEFNPSFKQEVLFKDGIKKTIDYVLSHKECQIIDTEFDEFCDKLIEKIDKLKEEF